MKPEVLTVGIISAVIRKICRLDDPPTGFVIDEQALQRMKLGQVPGHQYAQRILVGGRQAIRFDPVDPGDQDGVHHLEGRAGLVRQRTGDVDGGDPGVGELKLPQLPGRQG